MTASEMKKLEIRPLNENDAAAFKQMRLQAILDSPSAVWPTYEEEAGRTVAQVEARIRKTGEQVVFGAFIGMQLVGIAGLRREPLQQDRHKATLRGVLIRSAQRREGLARKLLSELACFARTEGVLQIHLCVNAENLRALALYRSLGFEAFGLEPRAMRVGDRYFDEQHMLLRLGE